MRIRIERERRFAFEAAGTVPYPPGNARGAKSPFFFSFTAFLNYFDARGEIRWNPRFERRSLRLNSLELVWLVFPYFLSLRWASKSENVFPDCRRMCAMETHVGPEMASYPW